MLVTASSRSCLTPRNAAIYTQEILQSYRGKNRLEMTPHVYAIAESMYYNMKAYSENQCVIISGESGAGKTEAAKKIMEYIAAVSGEASGSGIGDIKDMVLATNPLLESFGCAKTLRNDNSSRHVSSCRGADPDSDVDRLTRTDRANTSRFSLTAPAVPSVPSSPTISLRKVVWSSKSRTSATSTSSTS